MFHAKGFDGTTLDADYTGDEYRVIQFTPPGSGCSIIFGQNVTAAAPGSAQGLYLIVSDIEAARKELLGCGVAVSEVFHDAGGVYAGPDEPYLFGRIRVSGPDPEHRSYRSYASFSDPDGNGWLLQEVTERFRIWRPILFIGIRPRPAPRANGLICAAFRALLLPGRFHADAGSRSAALSAALTN